MQKEDMIQNVKNNPKYQELVTKRRRFSWTMAVIMLIIYYGFIMTIAFAPGVLGTTLSEGAVTTVGIPVGIGVILSAFILTGIYVVRANTQFDRLNREIKEELL
jgi:uncharacterized membrane protein (DUF485 family)